MQALLEKTPSEIGTPAQTPAAIENIEPLPKVPCATRRQRIIAALSGLVAIGTLGGSLYIMLQPPPNHETSTPADTSTWYGDLPPGTIDRPVEELTTAPTEEPTDWKTLSTGTSLY